MNNSLKYFSIEPFVYKTNVKSDYLLYNTLNNQVILLKDVSNLKLKKFLNCIFQEKNLGVVSIDQKELNHETKQFVFDAVEKNIAKITEKTKIKPIQFFKYNLLQKPYKDAFNARYEGKEIVKTLNNVTLHLANDKSIKYKDGYLQFPYPISHGNKMLSANKLIKINDKLLPTNNYLYNIFSLNILKENAKEIVSINNKLKVRKQYFLIYNKRERFNLFDFILNNESNSINLIIDNFEKELNLVSQDRVNFSFIVKNENEFKQTNILIDKNNILNFRIFPYYNNKNINFFKKYIFFNEHDILASNITYDNILMNYHINSNFYGKLEIFPEGDTYSNINKKSIGNIFRNSLNELLYKENYYYKNWFILRKNFSPCMSCVFKSFCPPISNYELVLKKVNLCKLT